MKKTIILSLLFSAFLVEGQTIDSFSKLKSEGPIPDFFIKYLDEKIKQDKADLKKDNSISTKNAQDFSAITNYKLQQLIQSGRVLYGDPLTTYANKVLDKLKAHSSEDINDISIYTLKSNEVNAFATHQRVIFITVGLWGQIENEAQLAFVLAHELSHITKKHNQLSYQHTKDLTEKGKFGDDVISQYYKYSKDNEEDADHLGYKLALKAGYDATSLFKTFNVLLYSYLPIDEMKVTYEWLENEQFKITEDYILDELNEISAEEDLNDKYHTHPNIANRRKNIKSLYKENKDKENKTYVVESKAKFKEVQTVARFEMMNIFLTKAQYADALYHNLILQKKYPNNTFLKNTSAMIWYGLTAFTNSDNGLAYRKSYKKREGEKQQLYYLLYKLRDKNIATIATKQIWEASIADPENQFLITLREKVLDEFVKFDDNKPSNYATEFKSIDDSVEVEEEIDEEELSKYDKIAKKKKTEDVESLTYYSLVNVLESENFMDSYREAEKKAEDKNDKESNSDNKLREPNLDISSLIMITPNFYKSDTRKSINKNVNKNELSETRLVSLVQENADKLDISLQFVNDFKSTSFTTENYNEFSLLFDYLGERAKYGGLDFLPYHAKDISDLTKKYNTNYVGMINIYTEIDKHKFAPGFAVLSALTVYLFPLYLKWQLTADKSTDYGFYVMSLETHNPVYVSSKFFDANMNVHLQNAHIYNSLNQIRIKK